MYSDTFLPIVYWLLLRILWIWYTEVDSCWAVLGVSEGSSSSSSNSPMTKEALSSELPEFSFLEVLFLKVP